MFLDWIRSYLNERQQFMMVNYCLSFTFGISQGLVLGQTLFTLFTNNFPSSASSGSLHCMQMMLVYCIGEIADTAIAQFNAVLQELHAWCFNNRLTLHPGMSEVMLLNKGTLMGSIALVLLGTSNLMWLQSRLAGLDS